MDDVVYLKDFGAKGDGVSDDTESLVFAINALTNGKTLDLGGGTYNLFVGHSGTLSGDAIPLDQVPRIFNKSNLLIRNGTIRADSRAVSAKKRRYPTTFTVDGCSNILFEDIVFESKGENYGDTDASRSLSLDDRRTFAAQNGGHALLVVRSEHIHANRCEFRFCGSVATFYSMSSSQITLTNCFSNPASLGYAAYAFDSWAGGASVSGFEAHTGLLNLSSARKEEFEYGSKGCVITEDTDVSVIVIGGHYADAYANGSDRDIGYAFGATSSQTIVDGATVDNCASVGYVSASNRDFTYLVVRNVVALNLRKTVLQSRQISFSKLYFKFVNCKFHVNGVGAWTSDDNLTRSKSSYLALANTGNTIVGEFASCNFRGAEYGFISTVQMYGLLKFKLCSIETDGYLWDCKNIGSGSGSLEEQWGITFDRCNIRDISLENDAYTKLKSGAIYTYIDLSSSTITLNTERPIEASIISNPSKLVLKFSFPRDDEHAETLASSRLLLVDDAKRLIFSIEAGEDVPVFLPRPDKYKFLIFTIENIDSEFSLTIKNYTNTTLYLTVPPRGICTAWNDGERYHVNLL